MSIDLTAPEYLITAPAGVDGYGAVAALNNTAHAHFVGYIEDLTFARAVRESADDIPEGHGGVHGSFYSGRLPFSMKIRLKPDSTTALSNARCDKLLAALNAMEADGSIVWTEAGREATRLLFRQQESPRGPDDDRFVTFSGVSALPYIVGNALNSGAPHTNLGKAPAYPTITFTSGASGNVVLTRSSPTPSKSVTLAIGTNGIAASTSTVVDFYARTVKQGTAFKQGAIAFPSSTWWAMAPGANTISVTGASGATVEWRNAWQP